MPAIEIEQVPEGDHAIFTVKGGERFFAWVGCNDRAAKMFWIDKDGCNEPLEWGDIEKVEADDLFTRPIASLDEAKAWVAELCRRGLCFHFEDDPDDVMSTVTGQRTFTAEQSPLVRERVAELYAIEGFDPIERALDIETPGWREG